MKAIPTASITITAPGKRGFCCMVELQADGFVIRAAPIVTYMRGWTRDEVLRYCVGRGWTTHETQISPVAGTRS